MEVTTEAVIEANNNLTLKLVDESNNEPISDSEFQLIQDGVIIQSGITDDNGIIKMNKLSCGKYILMQISTKRGYKYNQDINYITIVKNNQDISFSIYNSKMEDTYSIQFINENGEKIIDNCLIEIKNNATQEIVYKGYAIKGILNIPLEKSTEYTLDYLGSDYENTSHTFKTETNDNLELQLIKKNGTINITFYDATDKQTIPYGEFELLDSKKEIINDSYIMSDFIKAISNIPYDTYYIKQTSSNGNYEINNNEFKVVLNDINDDVTITIPVTKKNIETYTVNFTMVDNKGNFIPNVTISLLDTNNKQIATGLTNTYGQLIFSNIPKGNYKYMIIDLPKGYKDNSTIYNLSLTDTKLVEQQIQCEKIETIVRIRDINVHTLESKPFSKITINNIKYTTNEKGLLEIPLEYGNYKISNGNNMIKIRIDGKKDYEDINLGLPDLKSGIKIKTLDTKGNKINVMTYALYYSDGTLVKNYDNIQANQEIENLDYGDYYLLQSNTGTIYSSYKEKVSFTINSEEKVDITFINPIVLGNIMIMDEDVGTEYTLYNSNAKSVGVGKIDESKSLIFSQVPLGNYTIKCTNNIKNDNYEVEVTLDNLNIILNSSIEENRIKFKNTTGVCQVLINNQLVTVISKELSIKSFLKSTIQDIFFPRTLLKE